MILENRNGTLGQKVPLTTRDAFGPLPQQSIGVVSHLSVPRPVPTQSRSPERVRTSPVAFRCSHNDWAFCSEFPSRSRYIQTRQNAGVDVFRINVSPLKMPRRVTHGRMLVYGIAQLSRFPISLSCLQQTTGRCIHVVLEEFSSQKARWLKIDNNTADFNLFVKESTSSCSQFPANAMKVYSLIGGSRKK